MSKKDIGGWRKLGNFISGIAFGLAWYVGSGSWAEGVVMSVLTMIIFLIADRQMKQMKIRK